MEYVHTPVRTALFALVAAVLLALTAFLVLAGLPGLADRSAGNSWHKQGNGTGIAGNSWHTGGNGTLLAGNSWH